MPRIIETKLLTAAKSNLNASILKSLFMLAVSIIGSAVSSSIAFKILHDLNAFEFSPAKQFSSDSAEFPLDLGEQCFVCGSSLFVLPNKLNSLRQTCTDCGQIFERCCFTMMLIQPDTFQYILGCRICGTYAAAYLLNQQTVARVFTTFHELNELLCIFCDNRMMPIA